MPFVELNREIERVAGCSLGEVHALYGAAAYRRYERRALEDVLARHAGGGDRDAAAGSSSEPATFNLLLAQCFTVWLQATPEEHMRRVDRAGRPAADGGQPRGDGRPAAHPRRARAVLRQGRRRRVHQRDAARAAALRGAASRAIGARRAGARSTRAAPRGAAA